MNKFKPGQLVIWRWKGVPQFLAVVTNCDEYGVHYKRLVAFEDYKTPLDGPGNWVTTKGLKDLEIING